MYEKLVKRLRNCATEAAPCKTCDMVGDGSCSDTLMKEAADAIEELSKRVPVPPHGRLIDADAFDERIRIAGGLADEELTDDFKDGVQTTLLMLKTQKTIIPAEEGET